VEPHLDAIAILSQAGATGLPADCTWGVFAAEGPGVRLEATPTGDTWLLDGVKPWCSLAGSVRAALVTAHVDGGRRLFAVDLHQSAIEVERGTWAARGLVDIPSGSVRFTRARATPIGEREWYLTRPGFAWGGIGVAACWYGGAVALARSVHAAVDAENPLLAMHLGAIDVALHASALALADAAQRVDAGLATGAEGALLAKRVRTIVANACETVLERAAHALGPAPLALDAEHAQRVADLTLYVRQHHAERDLASLGRGVAELERPW
jgi:alkylation response protein AidB-like acyl-CoA dehydrogenase